MSVKRVGIAYHPLNEAAHSLAKKLAQMVKANNIPVWISSAWKDDEVRAQVPNTDLVLTTGGDGTILRVAQAVLSSTTLVLGINLGRLGFMTELSADEAIAKLPALLKGEGWVDERALLEAELFPADKERSKGQVYYALNDVIVARGEVARIIHIETTIDNTPFATYRADGVIVATATGSTGYSLSAGGPILKPQADDFLLLPILPHLSPTYRLVLPPETAVKLRVSTTHQAMLSIDGHIHLPLANGDIIKVKHSDKKVHFLRIRPRTSFYSTLEQSLKGNN